MTPHCLRLWEDAAPPLKSNIAFAAELGVNGGEGEDGSAADTTESGDIDLLSPVEERDPPDKSSTESTGGSNGWSATGGVYGGDSINGAKGMSLLCRLTPWVFADSSFFSSGSVPDAVFSSRASLDSVMVLLSDTLLTQSGMDDSSGDVIGESPLPSSLRAKKGTLVNFVFESAMKTIQTF